VKLAKRLWHIRSGLNWLVSRLYLAANFLVRVWVSFSFVGFVTLAFRVYRSRQGAGSAGAIG
jgi:hypothetical protein